MTTASRSTRHLLAATATLLLGFVPLALASSAPDAESKEAKAEAKAQAQREEIDAMAQKALDQVLAENPGARQLLDESAGHAVFDNWHTSFALAGGSGVGVAVRKSDGARTYMKMRTVGIKIGFGIQKCQVVLLFQTPERFRRFVESGWEAEAGADAAAGTEGGSVGAGWRDGLAVYQITEKGLMLSADLSGTKYFPAKKLN